MPLQNNFEALSLVYKLYTNLDVHRLYVYSFLDENINEDQIIKYIFDHKLIDVDSLQTSIETTLEQYKAKQSGKSIETCDHYFEIGMKLFDQGRYPESVHSFSKALRYLPMNLSADSSRLLVILLKRFQALQQLNLTEQSLRNVSHCLNANEEESKTLFTDEQIEEAKNLKKIVVNSDENSIDSSFNLRYKNDSLTYRSQATFVASKPIPAGTTVLTEQPYSFVPFELDQYCCNCNLKVETSFWPCEFCNEVVFCDKTCFDEGFESFHKNECGLVGLLLDTAPSYLQLLRFYSKSGQNAISSFEPTENYLLKFKQFYSTETPEDGCNYKELALNSYRQAMYQSYTIPGNIIFKLKYFGYMYQAIEFYYIYDFCLQNGIEKSNIKMQTQLFDQLQSGEDLSLSVDQFLLKYNETPLKHVPFSWISGVGQDTDVLRILKDYKFFTTSQFVYAYQPWALEFDRGSFPSATPILTSFLSFSKRGYNAESTFDQKSGFYKTVTLKDIAEDDQLVIRSSRRKINFRLNYSAFITMLKNNVSLNQEMLRVYSSNETENVTT